MAIGTNRDRPCRDERTGSGRGTGCPPMAGAAVDRDLSGLRPGLGPGFASRAPGAGAGGSFGVTRSAGSLDGTAGFVEVLGSGACGMPDRILREWLSGCGTPTAACV